MDSQAVYDWLGTTQGIRATPHSQRCCAQIRVKLANVSGNGFPITALIDQVESALKTPVQATVKREDEQEFARLNASNLMFCEDAARRLKQSLSEADEVADFWVRVNHMESLHAHDAVAIAIKGVENGYRDRSIRICAPQLIANLASVRAGYLILVNVLACQCRASRP